MGPETPLVVRRAMAGLLVVAAAAGSGCGNRTSLDVPEGCSSGDAVPQEVRESIFRAAETFYVRARGGEWGAVYENASEAVRTQRSQEAFVTPIARAVREVGIPEDLTTLDLSTVHFGVGFPHRSHVSCPGTGEGESYTLLLTEQPLQASMVQRGGTGKDRAYISTLWHGEDGEWKLAGFFAKPATLLGGDWTQFAAAADSEYVAGRKRNAALLYNVAIDLVVPCAWIRPDEVDRLQKRQSRISVEGLPKGAAEPWPVPPDTIRVRRAGYGVARDGLCVMLRVEAQEALADTAAQNRMGTRLVRYVEETYPEYPIVFRYLAVVVFDPQDPNRTWNRLYPFRRAS